MKLRLTVVDTPGYGDAINSQDWYVTLALILHFHTFIWQNMFGGGGTWGVFLIKI